jgi:hypothetical protein
MFYIWGGVRLLLRCLCGVVAGADHQDMDLRHPDPFIWPSQLLDKKIDAYMLSRGRMTDYMYRTDFMYRISIPEIINVPGRSKLDNIFFLVYLYVSLLDQDLPLGFATS